MGKDAGVDAWWRVNGRDAPAALIKEAQTVVDRVAAFVDEPVMARAEEDEVVEIGWPASRPVLDVVRVYIAAGLAAGKAAGAVGALSARRSGVGTARDLRPMLSGRPDRCRIRTTEASQAIRCAVSGAIAGPSSSMQAPCPLASASALT
jgi:hypothetical protein